MATSSTWLTELLAERERARTTTEVVIGSGELRVADVVAVARFGARVRLDDAARSRMERSRAVVERLIDANAKVYGLTTGFGPKRDVLIGADEVEALQRNLVRSHACGTGPVLPEDVVRAMMFLRAATIARGFSGVRPVLVERLAAMLDASVYPLVPSRGSVGASGDLAQLSHLALVLMGEAEGRVHRGGAATGTEDGDAADVDGIEGGRRARPGLISAARPSEFEPSTPASLVDRFGIEPVTLLAKEGLALINGTQGMAAIGALVLWDALETLVASELGCALSLEGQKGVRDAFDPRIHAVRPVPGQAESAWLIRAAIDGSEVLSMPLSLPRLDRAVRELEDAIEHLGRPGAAAADDDDDDGGGPALVDDLRARLERTAGALRAIRATPRKILDDAMASAGLDVADGWATSRAARPKLLRALDATLAGPKRELLGCYQMTLGSALPAGSERAREFIAAAIGEVELAVPESPPVQDDYSYRCAPQVLGAVRANLDHARRVLEAEFGAVTDNPLVFPPDPPAELTVEACRDAVVSGGNFHGEPLAFVLDLIAIVLVEVASISERRIAHLTDGRASNGLPSLLVERAGLRSGFLIPQYTAAALVSEAKTRAHPASVDSIPTGEGTEDHVSMGLAAAHKARAVLDLAERVVAIELLTGVAAARFRGAPEVKLGRATMPLFELLDANVPPLDEDRALGFDMDRVLGLVRSGAVVDVLATLV